MDRVVETIRRAITAQQAIRMDRPVATEEEFIASMALTTHQATSTDALCTRIFKESSQTWAKVFPNVINAVRHTETILPTCLTIFIIVLLYKKGSADRVENYKPVALVNVFTKIVSSVYCKKSSHCCHISYGGPKQDLYQAARSPRISS